MNPVLLFFAYVMLIRYFLEVCFFIVKGIKNLIKILNGTKELTLNLELKNKLICCD